MRGSPGGVAGSGGGGGVGVSPQHKAAAYGLGAGLGSGAADFSMSAPFSTAAVLGQQPGAGAGGVGPVTRSHRTSIV
jgi:hypothetical protein